MDTDREVLEPKYKYDAPEYETDHLYNIKSNGGIASLAERTGARVGIVGAGVAGLSAAYELARLGVLPVVYEASERIGGRIYSYRFPGDKHAIAELGAMRFPPTSRLLFHYLKQFNISTQLFPDPLVVPTTIAFHDFRLRCNGPDDLPEKVKNVSQKWQRLVDSVLHSTRKAASPKDRLAAWKQVIDKYCQTSFHRALVDDGWNYSEINLFGSLGLGTGGFDSIYHSSFLEVLRIELCHWEDNQQLIIGGADQVTTSLWTSEVSTHGFGSTSVAKLNEGRPRPAVTRITREGSKLVVLDRNGGRARFDSVIVTCPLPVLQLHIEIDPSLLSRQVVGAIKRVHQVGSTKVFARTKTAFWKHDRQITPCILTDAATRGTYLFDFETTSSGVACLSYTWEDDSRKMLALNDRERVALCRQNLSTIFGHDIFEDQILESVTISWEQASGYHGAFKLNRPGEHHDQKALYDQGRGADPIWDNGLYLAGDGVSFSGGWVEGALVTGLNAATAAIRRIDQNRR